MDADSHKSAHHVTIVTDAGGFVKIESPAEEILFLICVHLCASADKRIRRGKTLNKLKTSTINAENICTI